MIDQLCNISGLNPDQFSIDKIEKEAWVKLWELALRHRVGPVLIDRLKASKVVVPDDISRLMSDHNMQNTRKGLRYSAELINITQLFQKNNVPFLSFKGLAFNKLAQLELLQRHTGDMDILLTNYSDIKKADKLLIETGYKRVTLPKTLKLNARQDQYFFNYCKDITYTHPQKRIKLELHFKLFLIDETCPLSSLALYQNRSMVKIGSTAIPVMNKTDHQLYLLVHGAWCGWFRLKWLFDIPMISNNGHDYMSEDFWHRAKSLGIERMVVQGLWLAHEMLDMPIAGYIKKYRQQNERVIQKLIGHARKQIEKEVAYYKDTPEKMTYLSSSLLWYRPSLREDIAYKSKHILSSYLLTADWHVIPLPSYLFWLYFPLRPLLWLYRKF